MKLCSKGLGRTELEMDFRCYEVVGEKRSNGNGSSGDGVVGVYGTITTPVNWDFRVEFGPEDVPGLIRIALTTPFLKMIFRNLLLYFSFLKNNRKFRQGDREEVIAKVKKTHATMVMGVRSRRVAAEA
jgi:hypothetical protein